MGKQVQYEDKSIQDLNMEISEESLSTGESDNKDSDVDTKQFTSSKYSSSIKEQTKVSGMYD